LNPQKGFFIQIQKGFPNPFLLKQSRSLLAAASCGSAGYTGVSLALVGLLGLVAWAWRHGLRTGWCAAQT